jgi:hypothetical protein
MPLQAGGARPAVTSAAAGAAISGTMMRVMGVDVPYSYVIGTGGGDWQWRRCRNRSRDCTSSHCHMPAGLLGGL